MVVSLVDVPRQPGRRDPAFSVEPSMTEFSIVILHSEYG